MGPRTSRDRPARFDETGSDLLSPGVRRSLPFEADASPEAIVRDRRSSTQARNTDEAASRRPGRLESPISDRPPPDRRSPGERLVPDPVRLIRLHPEPFLALGLIRLVVAVAPDHA